MTKPWQMTYQEREVTKNEGLIKRIYEYGSGVIGGNPMKSRRIHYRLYSGNIACGQKSSNIDATSVREGVTCKHCLNILLAIGVLK